MPRTTSPEHSSGELLRLLDSGGPAKTGGAEAGGCAFGDGTDRSGPGLAGLERASTKDAGRTDPEVREAAGRIPASSDRIPRSGFLGTVSSDGIPRNGSRRPERPWVSPVTGWRYGSGGGRGRVEKDSESGAFRSGGFPVGGFLAGAFREGAVRSRRNRIDRKRADRNQVCRNSACRNSACRNGDGGGGGRIRTAE